MCGCDAKANPYTPTVEWVERVEEENHLTKAIKEKSVVFNMSGVLLILLCFFFLLHHLLLLFNSSFLSVSVLLLLLFSLFSFSFSFLLFATLLLLTRDESAYDRIHEHHRTGTGTRSKCTTQQPKEIVILKWNTLRFN